MILAIAMSFNIHQNLIHILCIVHATANQSAEHFQSKTETKTHELAVLVD